MIEPERIVKGAYFPAEEIDAIFGIKPEDPMRGIILLAHRARIEDDHGVVVRVHQGGLRVLPDAEVPPYVVSRALHADRTVKRNSWRLSTIDTSTMTTEELRGLEFARSLAAAQRLDLDRRTREGDRFG